MIGATPYMNMSQFLIYVIIAGLIYQGVRMLRGLTWSTVLSESNALTLNQVLDNFLLIYEPLALLLLLSALIAVKPAIVLPIVVILLIISHKHWRNYISRSVVLINNRVKPQVHIISGAVEGKVIGLRRLGVDIQTQKGIHNISYQSLLDNGYTISEGERISRLYILDMIVPENARSNPSPFLMDKLANTPYIDWQTAPQIEVQGIDNDKLSLKVVLRDRSHLDEVVSLLHEWRYTDITVHN